MLVCNTILRRSSCGQLFFRLPVCNEAKQGLQERGGGAQKMEQLAVYSLGGGLLVVDTTAQGVYRPVETQ